MRRRTIIAGRFEVEGETSGGLLRAVDVELGEQVVLKPQRDPSPAARDLLLNELKVRAEVEHPCLVPYRGIYEEHGTTYLVQKWVDGSPLERVHGQRIDSVALQLLEALHCLHERGIVHGDLKPEHVVVRPDGQPTVLDFDAGVCRWQALLASDPVFISGTPGFMAPELTWGAPLSPATDLFALGATLATLPQPPPWASLLTASLPEDRVSAAEQVLGRRWDGYRLFGRTEELEQLDTWWEQEVPAVVIVGPGGIGKTSLARSWLQSLREAGVRVVHARCLSTARLGFQLADALVSAVTGAPVEPEQRPTPQAFLALAEDWLDRAERSVVWVDDVQSMDPDSAAYLEALLQARLDGLMVLQTTRRAPTRNVHTLELRGLGPDAATELIRHRSPLLIDHDVSGLLAQAEGVPLLLYHATRGGLSELCTAHRSPLLLALAVALQPVTLAGLAGERDLDRELAELVHVGLVLVDEGPAWSCSHDRVRETVVEQSTPEERRSAHASLACWAARQGAHPDIVLNHRVAAGGDEALLPEVLDAARTAWRQRAWAAAGHWYSVAMDLGDSSQNTCYRAAKGFSRGGQPRRAERQWGQLLERYPGHVDGRLDAAELAFSNGRIRQGFDLLGPLMRRVGVHAPGPQQTVAMLLAQLALRVRTPRRRPASEQDRLKLCVLWSLLGGLASSDGMRSVYYVAPYRWLANTCGSSLDRARARALYVAWEGNGRVSNASLDALEASVDAEMRDDEESAWLAWGVAYGRFIAGHAAVAEPWMDRALKIWQDLDNDSWERRHCAWHRVWAWYWQGRYEEASQLAQDQSRVLRRTGSRVGWAEVNVGVLAWDAMRRDDLDDQARVLREVYSSVDEPWFGMRYLTRYTQCATALYLGDAEAARWFADRIWNFSVTLRAVQSVRLNVHHTWLSAACISADRARMRSVAVQAARAMRGWGGQWSEILVAEAEAVRCWADDEDPSPFYEQVAQGYQTLGMLAHRDAALSHLQACRGQAPVALERLRERGVVRVEAYVNVLVPGVAAAQGARFTDYRALNRDYGL